MVMVLNAIISICLNYVTIIMLTSRCSCMFQYYVLQYLNITMLHDLIWNTPRYRFFYWSKSFRDIQLLRIQAQLVRFH
jgi:hypothetical protein